MLTSIPRAVKALYHTCKRVVEEAEDKFHERGKHWLAEGVDPRAFGPTQLWEKGRRGSVKNLNWHSHANLAILERMVIKDRILGTKRG